MIALDKLEANRRTDGRTNERTLAFLKLLVGAKKEAYIREDVTRHETKIHTSASDRQEKVIANVTTDVNPENIIKINEHIEQNIVKNEDGMYSCLICGRNSGKQKTHIKNHIETHLEGLCFNCPMCGKTFRSRHSLTMHKRRNHNN